MKTKFSQAEIGNLFINDDLNLKHWLSMMTTKHQLSNNLIMIAWGCCEEFNDTSDLVVKHEYVQRLINCDLIEQTQSNVKSKLTRSEIGDIFILSDLGLQTIINNMKSWFNLSDELLDIVQEAYDEINNTNNHLKIKQEFVDRLRSEHLIEDFHEK